MPALPVHAGYAIPVITKIFQGGVTRKKYAGLVVGIGEKAHRNRGPLASSRGSERLSIQHSRDCLIETLDLDWPVTFLVGENGSGKSTLA